MISVEPDNVCHALLDEEKSEKVTDFVDATNMHFVIDCAFYRNVLSIFYVLKVNNSTFASHVF